MARVVLSSKYAVLYRNCCVQGDRFKTRRCALLMFVLHDTTVTFSWLSSEMVSESLRGCRHVQCLAKCSGGQKGSPALGGESWAGQHWVQFCANRKDLFRLALSHWCRPSIANSVIKSQEESRNKSPASKGLGVSAQWLRSGIFF